MIGQSKPHIMYMGGGDPLTPPIESLAALPPEEQEEGEELSQPVSVCFVLLGNAHISCNIFWQKRN